MWLAQARKDYQSLYVRGRAFYQYDEIQALVHTQVNQVTQNSMTNGTVYFLLFYVILQHHLYLSLLPLLLLARLGVTIHYSLLRQEKMMRLTKLDRAFFLLLITYWRKQMETRPLKEVVDYVIDRYLV